MKKQQIRVPYGFSVHGKEEIDAVVRVLKGNTALGDKTKEFESKIARLFGKKYGIMVNSGSSANLLAFEILNLPKGSEVITPILTFATTVAPIIQKGEKVKIGVIIIKAIAITTIFFNNIFFIFHLPSGKHEYTRI